MTISRLTAYALALTGAFLVFILTNGIPEGAIFWNLLWADIPSVLLMLVVLLVGHWYGDQYPGNAEWAERMLRVIEQNRYSVAAVLWVVLCAGSLWVYRNHPLSMDEYAAVFQARVFAAGAMHGTFPPDLIDYLIAPDLQDNFLMVNRSTGAVMSVYWPGYSLLLAPFVWLGIPWACNPTLVVASFLLIGRVTRDLVESPHAAGWALLFALASPAFVANGITYYSMPAHLLFNLGFAWLLMVPTPLRVFLAGLTGGFALVLHNPFPHAAFALPWIVWLALQRGRFLKNMGFLAAGYLPVVLLLGMGWWLWRQQILVEFAQPLAAVQKAAVTVAPGSIERMQSLVQGFYRFLHWPDVGILLARMAGLVKLWLWASPLLLLLAWWGVRGEKRLGIRLLAASALLTFFAYFLIRFDQGHGWGYRYFHSAWGVLPVLAALGVMKLAETNYARVFRQVALLALASLVVANAMYFVQMGEFMRAHLLQFPPRVEAQRSIVLHNGHGYYALDLIQNDPWLRSDRVVFLTRSRADEDKIRKLFPGYHEISANGYGLTLVQDGMATSENELLTYPKAGSR